jgi:hypothetical protein
MSNSQILLVMVLHVALFLTFLYVLGRIWGDRFDTQHPFAISEGARRMIFGGVPTLCLAASMYKGEAIAHAVGEKAFPYVLFAVLAAYILGGYILYRFVPKRYVMPLGIAGWLTTFSLVLWLFVFTDPLRHFSF